MTDKRKVREVEVDLEQWAQNPRAHYRDGSLGVNTPFDMPAYVRVHRMVRATDEHDPKGERGSVVQQEELLGHKLTVDLITLGVQVQINLYHGKKSAKLIIHDDEGTEEVVKWES